MCVKYCISDKFNYCFKKYSFQNNFRVRSVYEKAIGNS